MPTDEEEAAIQAGIAADPDAREITDEEFAEMRPASEMMPPELYRALVDGFERRQREAEALRLDPDVLGLLRNSGPGWQERANALLRKALA